MVLKYKSVSPLYYREGQENEEFEQRPHNFEPPNHYVVEQEATTQGIRISKRIEPVLITKQETIILPRTKPTIAKGVPMVVKVKYSEPKIKQQNGSINSGVPRDWSRGIHSVNRVPRPNSPRCTYCHQIKRHINECPFIEDNVRQGFVEHFQNLNPQLVRVGNHGPIELEDLYHERVKILNKLREQIWRNNKSKNESSNWGKCSTYFCSSYINFVIIEKY